MTDHKIVMQQALDALENSSHLVFDDIKKAHLREPAIRQLRAAITQPDQHSMSGSEQNVLHKALLRTGRVVTYRPSAAEEFDKALRKHETNCCMFERGAQTLDDLLRSREEFIKYVQSI